MRIHPQKAAHQFHPTATMWSDTEPSVERTWSKQKLFTYNLAENQTRACHSSIRTCRCYLYMKAGNAFRALGVEWIQHDLKTGLTRSWTPRDARRKRGSRATFQLSFYHSPRRVFSFIDIKPGLSVGGWTCREDGILYYAKHLNRLRPNVQSIRSTNSVISLHSETIRNGLGLEIEKLLRS